MKNKLLGQRGIVVAIVLIIIAGISFLGFEAMRMARMDLAGSSVLRTRIITEGLMDAGITLARNLIHEDGTSVDGPYDVWNYFSSRCERLSLYFTTGTVTGVIEDENGRFALNSMAKYDRNPSGPHGLLTRLVEALATAHGMSGDAEDFADEVYNWIKPGSDLSSTLDRKYLNQAVPVQVPHAPMSSVEELLLIQWPDAAADDVEKLYYGTDQIPGLRDLVTIFGEGPLNVNTADRILLFALTTGDNHAERIKFAQRALSFRNNPQNSLAWDWISNLAQELNMEDLTPILTISGRTSKVFRVSLTATTGLGNRHAIAIFKRDEGQTQLTHIAF